MAQVSLLKPVVTNWRKKKLVDELIASSYMRGFYKLQWKP